jgi:hypothetical protein
MAAAAGPSGAAAAGAGHLITSISHAEVCVWGRGFRVCVGGGGRIEQGLRLSTALLRLHCVAMQTVW